MIEYKAILYGCLENVQEKYPDLDLAILIDPDNKTFLTTLFQGKIVFIIPYFSKAIEVFCTTMKHVEKDAKVELNFIPYEPKDVALHFPSGYVNEKLNEFREIFEV